MTKFVEKAAVKYFKTLNALLWLESDTYYRSNRAFWRRTLAKLAVMLLVMGAGLVVLAFTTFIIAMFAQHPSYLLWLVMGMISGLIVTVGGILIGRYLGVIHHGFLRWS